MGKKAAKRLPGEHNITVGNSDILRRKEPRDRAQGGSLTCAVAADHGNDATKRDLDADALDGCGYVVINDLELAHIKEGCRWC